MNELKYIESFSKEEILEKMQNYLNDVEADIENPRSDADDEFVGSIKKEVWLLAIQLAKQIDEPQKVTVPAFVAEKMKRYKSALWMLSSEYFDTSLEVDSDELTNWIDQNSEKFFRAWLDGYEIEEKPKWVVKRKDNGKYVESLALGKGIGLIAETTASLQENAYKLNSKDQADAVAVLIDGTVEKV
jgi:hypothetical protein